MMRTTENDKVEEVQTKDDEGLIEPHHRRVLKSGIFWLEVKGILTKFEPCDERVANKEETKDHDNTYYIGVDQTNVARLEVWGGF